MSSHDEKIYLGVGIKGDIDTIGKWIIEDFNRDDIKEVLCDLVDMIYDGIEDEEGETDD